MIRQQEIERIRLDAIGTPSGRRSINPDAVESLSKSLATIGLKTPITVRPFNEHGDVELVTGGHRLAAARKLGWDAIECIVVDCDEVEAELWEIAENLHRSDLTKLERDEQIARWVELAKGRKHCDPSGGVQPHEKGQSQAARELNVSEGTVRNAAKVAALTDEAKQAARETGLDDNQSALLKASKAAPEEQANVIRLQASNFPQDDHERSIKWRRSFEAVWNKAPSAEDRDWAKDWIDRPIMDQGSFKQ